MAQDPNELLSQFLAGQAAQKNPTGIFGLKITPYLTPKDQQALRFQELMQSLGGDQISRAAAMAGQGIGQGLSALFPKGQWDDSKPPDPQQEMLDVYRDALMETGDMDAAQMRALYHGAKKGVPGSMEKLQELQSKIQDRTLRGREVAAQEGMLAVNGPETVTAGVEGKPDMEQRLAWNPETKKYDIPVGAPTKKSSGVTVNTGEKREDKFADKIGEGLGDLAIGAIKDRGPAMTQKQNIAAFRALLQTGAKTGLGQESWVRLANFANSAFGLDLDPTLDAKQGIASLGNKFALMARNMGNGEMLAGSLSDSDRVFLQDMVPGLAKTPGGNEILLTIMDRLADRRIQLADAVSKVIMSPDKANSREALAAINSQFVSQNLFDDLKPQQGPIDKAALRKRILGK